MPYEITVLPATWQRWESRLYLQREHWAGTLFSDPGGIQGWVDLCYVKADRLRIEPATCQSQVQRPTAALPRNSAVVAVVVPVFVIAVAVMIIYWFVYSGSRDSGWHGNGVSNWRTPRVYHCRCQLNILSSPISGLRLYPASDLSYGYTFMK